MGKKRGHGFMLLMIIALLLVTMAVGLRIASVKGNDEQTKPLLEAVQTARAAARGMDRSGIGRATIEYWHLDQATGALVESPVHVVEFKYSDIGWTARRYERGDLKPLVGATLCRGGKQIRYMSMKGHPKEVVISHDDALGSISPLSTWSVPMMREIPQSTEEGHVFAEFKYAADARIWRVDRTIKMTVPVLVSTDMSGGHVPAQRSLEFDLNSGGQLTRYSVESKREERGQLIEGTTTVTAAWKTDGKDGFVPAMRALDLAQKQNGKEVQHARLVVTYDSLVTGPVKADDLRIAALGIPDGTPVVDETTGKQWRFSPGAENDRLFGIEADHAATVPAAK